MNKKLIVLATLLALTCSLVFAQATTEQVPTAKANTEPTLSGKVVVYCPSPNSLANKIQAGFEAKTGVKVEMFQGTTGKINARLEAEKANPIADVVILASWSDGLKLIDQAMPYDAKGLDTMNKGWVDPQHKLYGYSASAIGVIYNTLMYPTLSADWSELGSAQYADDICMPDPLSSGSCKDFITGFINANGENGWKIIEDWKNDGLTIPGANAAALEAVMTGAKGILISGVDYNAYAKIQSGEPIGLYYPKGGTVINPRPAFILKTANNLDNAKAYMDYLLSDEVQKMIYEEYLLPGRSDIVASTRANVSDINTANYDWNWMAQNSDSIMNRFTTLMGR